MEKIEKVLVGIDGLLEKISSKNEPYFNGQAVGLNYVKEIIRQQFPELKESEDERIRKFLLDYAVEMIAGLESDISRSIYDGIKGHDPDAEAELNQWQKARSYLERQKEQKEVADE